MNEHLSNPSEHEQLSTAEKLEQLLESVAPAAEYDRDQPYDPRKTKQRRHTLYPSEDPRETLTVLPAAGRWDVVHKRGRKSSSSLVQQKSGTVLPMEASDLPSAMQIDMSSSPAEVTQALYDLLEKSSTEKPEGKRSFGKLALKQFMKRP